MPDTTPGIVEGPCISTAMIAAYVDGTLSPEEREVVEKHLATCDDCLELVAEVTRAMDALGGSGAQSAHATGSVVVQAAGTSAARGSRAASGFRWRPVVAGAGLLAAAASILLVIGSRQSPLSPLVASVGPQRLIEARPTGGFQYGPLRSSLRGEAAADRAPLIAEAARLGRRAAETGDPVDVHAWGIAQILAGDARAGTGTLDSLRTRSPGVAAYEADLGAGLMTLFFEGNAPADATRAREALDRAIAIDPALPEALFNRALLLERLGAAGDALQAWNRYLDVDARSPWADEARRHRDGLQQSAPAR